MEQHCLLLSSSYVTEDRHYLGHCREAIGNFLGNVKKVTVVPYAAADGNYGSYLDNATLAFGAMGYRVESIEQPGRTLDEVALQAQAFFVAGGNTFCLLNRLYEGDLINTIGQQVTMRGVPYIGVGAGTNVACPSISTTNDFPIEEPSSLEALSLVGFQINPHYAAAGSISQGVHMGEMRDQRIQEYLSRPPRPNQLPVFPVIALREASWLRIEDDLCTLEGGTPEAGNSGGRLFSPRGAAVDLSLGEVILL